LLVEQRRTIRRLSSGQRHLCAGDPRDQQRAANPSPIARVARSFLIQITFGVHRLYVAASKRW